MERTCRCCQSKGPWKDIFRPDKSIQESYSNLLQNCFNIILRVSPKSGICNLCIIELENSCRFKKNVLQSEQELTVHLKNTEDIKPIIKAEVFFANYEGQESDDNFITEIDKEQLNIDIKEENTEDSDDCVLAEAVRRKKKAKDASMRKIKNSIKKGTLKVSSGSAIDVNVKTMGFSSSNDTKEAIKKETPNVFKIGECTVNRTSKSHNSKKVTNELIKKLSRSKTEKEMNTHNLNTILKYSNANLFRNRSVLGYNCAYCFSRYLDPVDLRNHTENDHNKCKYSIVADSIDNIVKLDVSDLECNLCKTKFDNLAVFKQHLIKEHNEVIFNGIRDCLTEFKLQKGDQYDCSLCAATYETFKMLNQHMNLHYRNYTCDLCGNGFISKRSLGAHVNTHKEGNFKCEHCEKTFPTIPKKRYHEKIQHLGIKRYKTCHICDAQFSNYYQRNSHLTKVHNAEPTYKCKICEKGYVLKSLLMYHIQKCHMMEKNVICNECGYRFFSKKALKNHMVKHNGEKLYVCEFCNKSYARKCTLREHLRIHENDRRFKCNVCQLSFVQKCSLRSHMLSNHGLSVPASDITATQCANE